MRRAHLQAHLAHGLEEGQRLDVADGAADLDDGDVHLLVGAPAHELLDLVGDVRDHLHRLAEVVAAALLLEHALVDLAGREVVRAAHPRGDVALVVAEVEVGLGTVVGDEDLAVLERRHRARIDVEIGVELDQGDLEAPRFEDRGKRRRSDALAQRGHHTAGDKDELGHCMQHLLFANARVVKGDYRRGVGAPGRARPSCISAWRRPWKKPRSSAALRPRCPPGAPSGTDASPRASRCVRGSGAAWPRVRRWRTSTDARTLDEGHRALQRMGAQHAREVMRQRVVDRGLDRAVEGQAPFRRAVRGRRAARCRSRCSRAARRAPSRANTGLAAKCSKAASALAHCWRRRRDTCAGDSRSPMPAALATCSARAFQPARIGESSSTTPWARSGRRAAASTLT